MTEKFLKMHDVILVGVSYFKTSEGVVLTYKYIFEWLKLYGGFEFCSEVLFRKFINQLIFQIEVIK